MRLAQNVDHMAQNGIGTCDPGADGIDDGHEVIFVFLSDEVFLRNPFDRRTLPDSDQRIRASVRRIQRIRPRGWRRGTSVSGRLLRT